MKNKNRRGWIRIVEAFLSIILIIVVLVLVVNQQNTQQNNAPAGIYGYEIYTLRAIELSDTFRSEVLGIADSTLPLNSDNDSFPNDLRNYVTIFVPSSLSCASQICETNDTCNLWKNVGTDVYAERVFITSSPTIYNPRQIKLFCWLK